MATVEVMGVLLAAGNTIWAILNWMTFRKHRSIMEAEAKESSSIQDQAKVMFESAKRALIGSSETRAYGVCKMCERIVAHYTVDTHGNLVCVNCESHIARGVN